MYGLVYDSMFDLMYGLMYYCLSAWRRSALGDVAMLLRYKQVRDTEVVYYITHKKRMGA